MDNGLQQFNVVLTYGTYATSAEEALSVALTAIEARSGVYIEVYDDAKESPVLEGESLWPRSDDSALAFEVGQQVRVLVKSVGADNDDEEREYPAGTLGTVCLVDEGGRVHVEIGNGDRQITQVYDPAELPTSLEHFNV